MRVVRVVGCGVWGVKRECGGGRTWGGRLGIGRGGVEWARAKLEYGERGRRGWLDERETVCLINIATDVDSKSTWCYWGEDGEGGGVVG